MSDGYEPDYTAEYNALVRQYDRLVDQYNQLVYDVQAAECDVSAATELMNNIRRYASEPLKNAGDHLEQRVESAREVLFAIEELRQDYLNIKNVSYSAAMLTNCQERYYTYFGDFNALRRIALGYVVGVDANLWQTDAPRKTVEKAYLANTDYWLAYAAMSVMLWASDEQETALFAVSKAMQMNPEKSALYYLLINLRFDRQETAKEWFKIYLDMVDPHNVGRHIEHLLLALLSGAMGRDREFESESVATIKRLFEDCKNDPDFDKNICNAISEYFDIYVNVTSKEYINLRRTCAEYGEMTDLLSEAEKNKKLKEYFENVLKSDPVLNDSLSERIEDVLYNLIESYDDKEKALLDETEYHEIMVKAKGNKEIAEETFYQIREKEKKESDLAMIFVSMALDYENKTSNFVKKFALNVIRDYCKVCAKNFALRYRNVEKAKYDIRIDDWKAACDENDYKKKKGELLKHDKAVIRNKIKGDKTLQKLKKGLIISCVIAVIMIIVALFAGNGATSAIDIVLWVLSAIGIVFSGIFLFLYTNQYSKLKKANQYIIDKNQLLLKNALEELGRWRADYKAEDAINEELIKVFDQDNQSINFDQDNQSINKE